MTARIGSDLLGITEVASRYTVGSEPGCDFAVTDIGMFALVSTDAKGLLVRRPIGLDLTIDGHASSSLEARVTRDSIIALRFGLATLEISLVERAPATLPFTASDLRALPFIAGSCVAHLALVVLAFTSVHPKNARPIPRTVAHPRLVHLPPPPPPPTRIAAPAPRSPHVRRPTRLPGGSALAGVDVGSSIGALVAAAPDLGRAMEGLKLHNPELDAPPGFGEVQAMTPRTRAGWGAIEIKTGVYKTVSHDRDPPSANDLATTQQLALCESYACQATGPLTTAEVKTIVEQHMAQIATCTGRLPSFKVALEIAPDGTARAHGDSGYAHCVSDALTGLAFPKASGPTHVDFTVGFPPS